MRSVDEKYKYNEKRGGAFGNGYCFAVRWYRDYPKMDNETKKVFKEYIDGQRELAKYSDMQDAKGFMCGIRDAANERKSRKGK